MALHATWDLIALTQMPGDSLHGVAPAGVMFAGLLIDGGLVVRAARESRRRFGLLRHHRLFGWPFSRLIRE